MKSTAHFSVLLLFVILCLSVNSAKAAQTEEITNDTIVKSQLYQIVKINNMEYIGYILSDDGRELLIETQKLGKIYIPKSDIRNIEKISDAKSIVHGDYFGNSPFTTRYVFTTNALPLRKGQNYARASLIGPEVHFALTNHLSVGLMTTWAVSPFILVGKYSFQTKNPNINLSLGTMMGTSGWMNNMKTWGGIHFGSITYGNAKDNISFSGGYGYALSGLSEPLALPGVYNSYAAYSSSMVSQPLPAAKGPIISIAGITKVGAKASFIFDSMIGVFSVESRSTNLMYFSDGVNERYEVTNVDAPNRSTIIVLMPGMRFQTKENSAFQVSLNLINIYQPTDSYKQNITFPLPSCSWFFKF